LAHTIETEILSFLARLIAARSPNPPGDETAVAAVIMEEGRQLGLPEPRILSRRPERPNLIYEIGRGTPKLLFASHMDTMPPGDLSRWSTDPYRLTRVGDRLVGLGVADMKTAIATSLHAAARMYADSQWSGSLTLVYSADEEAGSGWGMEWLANEGILTADAAAVLEPASFEAHPWQRLFVGQRGSCVAWLVSHGEPGHSGQLVDATQRASWSLARALSALLENNPFKGIAHPLDGTPPTLNVGTMIGGGEVPHSHPAELRAAIEVRTIEGMTKSQVLHGLRTVVAGAGLQDRVTIEAAAPPLDWLPSGNALADGPLLRAARRAWQGTFGSEPKLGVLTAGTDSVYFDALGIPALPAFGPGSLAVAHQPNESLAVSEITQAVSLFHALIRAFQTC
jgi:acetylornithine deacetylase/succinyl-diaminopimelate desuccinylase-like protein